MEESDREAGWHLVFNRLLVLFLLKVVHLLQILLLEDERGKAIGLEAIHFVQVVLAVAELIVIEPAESCHVLLVLLVLLFI